MFFRVHWTPSYKRDVTDRRKIDEAAKVHEIGLRLKEFPKPHDAKRVRQFVMCKFEQAELLKETDVQMASEHVADALYMLSCIEANRLLERFRCTMSTKMYKSVDKKYKELFITKLCCVTGGSVCAF